MNNESIQDPGLSWAARGLLAYLISLPEKREVHIRDLFNRSADGRRPTETAMKELITAGYVVKRSRGKTSGAIQNIRFLKHQYGSSLCTKRTQKPVAFVFKTDTKITALCPVYYRTLGADISCQ
jgi:hypothetical protein